MAIACFALFLSLSPHPRASIHFYSSLHSLMVAVLKFTLVGHMNDVTAGLCPGEGSSQWPLFRSPVTGVMSVMIHVTALSILLCIPLTHSHSFHRKPCLPVCVCLPRAVDFTAQVKY